MKGSRLAPLRGTTSLYAYASGHKVLIMRDEYKYVIVSDDTFHSMYEMLTLERAALKEDCIEYVEHYHDKPLYDYPQWYNEAVVDGIIYTDGYCHYMCDDGGEIAMSPGSVILRNSRGQLRYMERNEFERYYEILEG